MLLLLAQAAAPPPAASDDIIVIGRRAEQELAACLARNCPPAEEIEASLQASVEQFADGRYGNARSTLQRAIRRTKDHAADLPGPVSSLYATLATVAEHEGNVRLQRKSARNNVWVLRRHVGEADVATLREELGFADALVSVGTADNSYARVQRRAASSGHAAIAAGAAFRRAWLALMRDRPRDAERFVDEAAMLAGPADTRMADLRDILKARIAMRRGDKDAVDGLAARLRRSASDQPQLLFAPTFADLNSAEPSLKTATSSEQGILFADLGYWIRPDGRTAQVEVLRTSRSSLGQWASAVVNYVGKRRYVPLDVEPGHPGLYRIDRFTIRAPFDVPKGTRIPSRIGDMTVHVIDLTETEAMSAAHRRRTQEAGSAEPNG